MKYGVYMSVFWEEHEDDKFIFGYAEFEVLIIHLFGNVL